MRGKIIEIEGTDCSGKRTQSELLRDRLLKDSIDCSLFSFPNYDTPTGMIIGGPFLGRNEMSSEGSWFDEGAPNVSKKIAAAYYVIDRAYSMPKIKADLMKKNVILDRWVDSNLAYNGASFSLKKDRLKMYKWLEELDYKVFGNYKADIRILLYVPFELSQQLKANRKGKSSDEYEKDIKTLKQAEIGYLEIAKRNKYKIINCSQEGKLLSREKIHEMLYHYVISKLGER